MEASKRVRVSEGFICHLLVLSALPSYKHAKRPGIPDKKRTATESSAEPHVRMSAATLDAWRQIPKKGKYNLHTPRQASGLRRVPAKCCSNTSVRAVQAFGGDRFSRVATQVTRSANPDGRSAAAIFFRARKSLVRTAVGVTLSITLTSSVLYPSSPQRSSTDRCGAPKPDSFFASARADCLFTRASSGSGYGDGRRSIISPTSVEELGLENFCSRFFLCRRRLTASFTRILISQLRKAPSCLKLGSLQKASREEFCTASS